MIINEGRPGKKLPTLTNPGVAGDLLSGKQLIGQDGNIITGTIPSKASTDISVSGRTVTVPAGYYPSQASKSIASATQATPSITVSTGGLITASATQSAGYVASGTKSATKQLTTQAGKTVTPSRTQQTAVASGRYTTGTVYVAGDSDLVAANIKKGVNIFGVAGTYEGMKVSRHYAREVTRNSNYEITLELDSTLPSNATILAFDVEFSGVLDDDIYRIIGTPCNGIPNDLNIEIQVAYDIRWQRVELERAMYQPQFDDNPFTISGSSFSIDISKLDLVSSPSFQTSLDLSGLAEVYCLVSD